MASSWPRARAPVRQLSRRTSCSRGRGCPGAEFHTSRIFLGEGGVNVFGKVVLVVEEQPILLLSRFELPVSKTFGHFWHAAGRSKQLLYVTLRRGIGQRGISLVAGVSA